MFTISIDSAKTGAGVSPDIQPIFHLSGFIIKSNYQLNINKP